VHYQKTVKRYNLELNPKEKRGSKLCLNNYTKILPRARLNHFLKNIRKKEIQPIYVLEIFRIKKSRFTKLLSGFR